MKTTVSIPGIHCDACVALIKDVSSDFPQIRQADVDLNAKTVTLEHADDFDTSQWIEELESLGDKYKVDPPHQP